MEEFYGETSFSLEVATLNRKFLAWKRTYNTLRSRQALGYLNSCVVFSTNGKLNERRPSVAGVLNKDMGLTADTWPSHRPPDHCSQMGMVAILSLLWHFASSILATGR